jgi:hypothetical protein
MKSFGCVSAHSVLGFRVPSLLHPNEPSLVGDPGFHPNKPSLVEDPGSLKISAGGSNPCESQRYSRLAGGRGRTREEVG